MALDQCSQFNEWSAQSRLQINYMQNKVGNHCQKVDKTESSVHILQFRFTTFLQKSGYTDTK